MYFFKYLGKESSISTEFRLEQSEVILHGFIMGMTYKEV